MPLAPVLPTFADPKTDFVFKRIFGAEAHKDLRAGPWSGAVCVPGAAQVRRGDSPQTTVEKWAYFFREAKNLDVVPPPLAERPFRDAHVLS